MTTPPPSSPESPVSPTESNGSLLEVPAPLLEADLDGIRTSPLPHWDDINDFEVDLLRVPTVVDVCQAYYEEVSGVYSHSRSLGPRNTEHYLGDVVRSYLGDKLDNIHSDLRSIWISKDQLFADNTGDMTRYGCYLIELETLMERNVQDEPWEAVDVADDIGCVLKNMSKVLHAAYTLYMERRRSRNSIGR